MKQVLVDARMVTNEGHGIARYVIDIAEALTPRHLSFSLSFLLSPSCPTQSPLRQHPHRESATPFLHPLEAWRLPSEIAAAKPDLFHSPSFMSLARYPCGHAQTVHDLNHLHFGGLPQKLYYRWLLLPSLRQARGIASVSESAAAELNSWLAGHGLRPSITIARNAIHELAPASPNALARLGLSPGAYHFCLSNPKSHKNVAMLTQAHAAAYRTGNVLPLATNVPGPAQEGLVRIGPLSEGEITALLAGAKAFFFPSHYEGFGRPPVEAALAGCPPVVADIPPLRDGLAGVKEAEFLPPGESDAWRAAFVRHSAKPAAPTSAASRAWIREEFSLQRLGDAMVEFYEKALSGPTPER